jgi:lysophospholipase L1-like esterase
VILALALAALTSAPFVDGDRVVWFGDSITAQHTYTRYVEEYVKLRHPELSVVFVNAGIGGQTAWDGIARFENDLLVHKPSVVFINFGMNDASYPPDTNEVAWEKNMATLFDSLSKAAVKRVVWIDPSPLDAEGLAPAHKNAKRALRLVEMADYAKNEGKKRGLTVVPFNESLTAAMTSWKAAGHFDRLMADRIHPGPQAYAVLAAAVLRSVGADMSAPTVTGTFKDGMLVVGGKSVMWDGIKSVSLDVASAPAPLPMIVDAKEAQDLGNRDVINLRKLMMRIDGLPADKRFRILAGDVDVGVFTGKQLVAGVDLMGNAKAREYLSLPADAPAAAIEAQCEETTGNPWLNDHYCLFDLLYMKDQLRILMRHERTRHLPDFVPDKLEQFKAFQRGWVEAVDKEIDARARAMRLKPHTVTLLPQ